jgi:hypothetical protein
MKEFLTAEEKITLKAQHRREHDRSYTEIGSKLFFYRMMGGHTKRFPKLFCWTIKLLEIISKTTKSQAN